VNHIAKSNGLEKSRDIKYLGETSPSLFMDHLAKNANHTGVGLLFCTENWQLNENLTFPCYFEQTVNKKLILYSIIYNTTLSFESYFGKDYEIALGKDPIAAALKISIDNGIAQYFSKEGTAVHFDIFSQDYPKTFFRFFLDADMCNRVGAFHYFIPFMVNKIFFGLINSFYLSPQS
jgi:hypothetical protein